MRHRLLPIAILALTAGLTAAAIQFLPQTLFFPVIEYTVAEGIHVAMYRTGELNRAACEQSAAPAARLLRQCLDCKLVERCVRGLDAAHRQILSRSPLAAPSAGQPGGALTITFAASDPDAALAACQQMAAQTANAQPANQRLTCHPPGTAR